MPRVVRKLASIRLWTEREDPWDESALRVRRDANQRAFAWGFQLKVAQREEVSFPSFSRCEVPTLASSANQAGWPAVVGVDLSSKSRPGNAIVVVRVEPRSQRRYVVDVRYGRWSAPRLADQLSEVDALYNPVVIKVEDNAYQEALIDMISDRKDRYRYWMRVEATTTTGGKKGSAELGLPSLELEFSHGAWVFPKLEYEGADGSPTGEEDEQSLDARVIRARAFARLAAEFSDHPFASTSDGVMATWFARQGIVEYGVGRGGGDDLALSGLSSR